MTPGGCDALSHPTLQAHGRHVPVSRRAFLSALTLPLLAACTPPLPPLGTGITDPTAHALLTASAAAHGSAALTSITDVNVRYAGHWRGLVGKLVPVLVDEGFRGGSEERLLLQAGLAAQDHTGPNGRKYVLRHAGPAGEGSVRVWFNGAEASDADRRNAAALVADGYSLFLLGPILLAGRWAAERSLTLASAQPDTITVGGQEHACDVLRVHMAPGIGLSPADDLAVFIGREDRLMHRVRFSLNGLDATQGAVAEVDTWGHVTLGGVRWPTRFHERLLRPLPLPVHDWQLDGLDLNRGLTPADIAGPSLAGWAARPATPLPGV